MQNVLTTLVVIKIKYATQSGLKVMSTPHPFFKKVKACAPLKIILKEGASKIRTV